jgi:hypothetical protein
MTAQAHHDRPGSDVPWFLVLVVAFVLVFGAAWALSVFFERRQRGGSHGPQSRENSR